MRYFQRSISYFAGFLSEDCAEKSFLCCKLCLSLRSYFTYQNITGADFCTDTDDSPLIKIFESLITDTRNITSDLFWSELSITSFCLVF